jgi:Flp pilus assembly protein CpaB
MEWHDDIARARAGDGEARERAFEYLTPFMHGVALSRQGSAVAHQVLPRIFENLVQSHATGPALGPALLQLSRDLSQEGTREASQDEAHQSIQHWPVSTEQREKLVLRLAEGVSGIEMCEVFSWNPSEGRQALRAAFELASGLSLTDDAYLWDLSGPLDAYSVRMETLLSTLRYRSGEPAVTQNIPAAHSFSSEGPTSSDAEALIIESSHAPESGSLQRSGPASKKPLPNIEADERGAEKSVHTVAGSNLPAAAQTFDRPRADPSPAASAPRESVFASAKTGRAQSEPTTRGSSVELNPDHTTARAPKARSGTSAPALRSSQEPKSAAPPSGPEISGIEFRQLFQGSTPFFLSGIFVLAAFATSWAGLAATERQAKAGWNLVPVLVSTADLLEGTTVVSDHVATRLVPAPSGTADGQAEGGGFGGRSSLKPDQVSFILNQRLAMPVQQGDPFFISQFVVPGEQEHLSTRVQNRLRAINIEVGVAAGVGHFVTAGDRVDLVAVYKSDESEKGREEAFTIAQNVAVLTVGKIAPRTPEAALTDRQKAYAHVTLLVIPEDAEAITLGASLGTIHLSLRSEEDPSELPTRDKKLSFTDARSLISGERHRQLERRRQTTINIIRRDDKAKPK